MAPVTYVPDFITDAGALFNELWDEVPWERRSDAPRRECWMNDLNRSYTYGRGAGERTYEPHPWHIIAKRIQIDLWGDYGYRLAGCFLNGYEGPRDHLGWHNWLDRRLGCKQNSIACFRKFSPRPTRTIMNVCNGWKDFPMLSQPS